ncbi:hypothetical protein FBU30_004150 [Linnemannia zychae]|nr:hypothetical protein FBU30_004150 [Linnemannia zychae]
MAIAVLDNQHQQNTSPHIFSTQPLLKNTNTATAIIPHASHELYSTSAITTTVSLPTSPNSSPLAHKKSEYHNRHQYRRHHQEGQHQHQRITQHPYQYNDALQFQKADHLDLATAPENNFPSLVISSETVFTPTSSQASLDLPTLLTAPTKVHIDRMGSDERSKILASLQLAIERAQAYRNELLEKDSSLLIHVED